MSQINYNELQLIVEKGMRDSGLQGDFEDGWKSVVVDGAGTPTEVKYNFQNMRDATAKAILDALTGVNVVGSLSTGIEKGVQTKIGSNDKINISTQDASIPDPLAAKAARVGDSTSIDITTASVFYAWCTAVATSLNSLGVPTPFVVPSIDGKITSGSTNVSIGSSNVQIGN